MTLPSALARREELWQRMYPGDPATSCPSDSNSGSGSDIWRGYSPFAEIDPALEAEYEGVNFEINKLKEAAREDDERQRQED